VDETRAASERSGLLAESDAYDVLLLDVHMPELDGFSDRFAGAAKRLASS
jgi:CheY-like chemotaxis protein